LSKGKQLNQKDTKMKKLIHAIYDRYFNRGTITTAHIPADTLASLLAEPVPEK
jgi:hypothetical protein